MLTFNQEAVLQRIATERKFPAQETSIEMKLDSRHPVKGLRRLSLSCTPTRERSGLTQIRLSSSGRRS